MKRISMLAALGLLCGPAGAQQQPSLQVLVGELDKDSQTCGISASAIEAVAALTLRNNGIRVVPKSNPYLYIQLSTHPIRIEDAMPGCAVHTLVQVRGINKTAKPDFNGFKAKYGAGTVLCQNGSLAVWRRSNIETPFATELGWRIKYCLGQLDY